MKTTVIQPHRSSLGLDANLAAMIIYIAAIVLSWIPFAGFISLAVPIVFFILEKESCIETTCH